MASRVVLGFLVGCLHVHAETGLGSASGGPYGGTPAQIPGLIQMEAFDLGGEGVGYSDTTSFNEYGGFRPDEGVDIYTTNANSVVARFVAGEYMRYTVNTTRDVDAFDFVFRMWSSNGDFSVRVVSGESGCGDSNTDLSGLLVLPYTGWEWWDFQVPGQGNKGLVSGSSKIWVCIVSAAGGLSIDYFTMMDAAPPSPAPTPALSPTTLGGPYGGTAVQIPGQIEAEEFDLGGEGVGYSDSTAGNKGGVFRPEEDVDIKARGAGYKVGAFASGEYLRYTVDVTQDVHYFFFSFLVASNKDTASFRVVSGGTGCDGYATDLSGLVSVPNTGGWNKYERFEVSGQGKGGLDAGVTQIWLCALSKYFNIDSFTMSAAEIVSTPYRGTPAAIPGVIEAEEFDLGGEGLAYSDTTTANSGEVFRIEESVDVGRTPDGYFVGWTKAGEYLQYTVDVSEDVPAFDFSFLMSGPPDDSGSFRIVSGGTGCDDYDNDLCGVVQAPSDGWWKFTDVKVYNAGLGGMNAGPGIIRLCVLSKRFNIDSFSMTAHIDI